MKAISVELDIYSDPTGSFAFSSYWVHHETSQPAERGCIYLKGSDAEKQATKTAETLATLLGLPLEIRRYTIKPTGGAS